MINQGEAIARFDGPLKVTGKAMYAADWNLPGQLYAAFVCATIPSGKVVSIDLPHTQRKESIRVITSTEIPRVHAQLDKMTVPPLATRFIPMQSNEVMHEGQPVAIVLGETLEAAEEAAKLVQVKYQSSKFTVPEDSESVPADPAKGSYSTASALDFKKGDPVAAMRSAPFKINASYSQPSRHANPMEPSAILASWQGDHLTVYDAVQHLPAVQNALAGAFGIPPKQVRVISPHTGGGFGAKAFIWPHEILAAMAARVVGRPVKAVLSRQQMYSMVGPQPLIRQSVQLGSSTDGKLLSVMHDVANITGLTDDYVEFGAIPGRSFYACENISTSHRVMRGNVTLPTFMRSPWDGPGSWALGSAIDELAHTLRIDPLELRLRNYAENDPESGKPWSSKKLREAYEQGAGRFGWHNRSKGGTRDGHWFIGCGMADCSQGQARFHSTARVRLKADGTAQIESSFCDIGTGPATIFPQVAAAVLGLQPSQVAVSSGDTNLPYSGPTYGSGTTISTGAAVQSAATRIKVQLARLCGWREDEVVLMAGKIARGSESRNLVEVMQTAGIAELASDGSFDLPGGVPVDMGSPQNPARTFGAIFIEVAVDPELGLLRLRRATGVYSAGRILNPRTATSQMIGGIVWGWGMAAMEASHFESRLGRWYAKDLAGVAIPVNADIPAAIDVSFVDEFDAKSGPLGAKGIGELGATGVAAAVGNAVFDAVGIRVRDLPITPSKLINSAKNIASS
jgi:xanthine dehydrogenase YagR molybdenum-binding subunit